MIVADDEGVFGLARLVVEALGVGSGKSEHDVVDEIFETYGIAFPDLDSFVPRRLPGRAEKLREQAAKQLAAAVPGPADLLNTVLRCGGRFVAMLDETYATLAKHAATTTGGAETFRLQRDGVDESQLTISPAFLERVHSVQGSAARVTVGVIDEDGLSRLLGWDNGELCGQWPLSDSADRIRLADSLLHLSWIRPILQQRSQTEPAWAQALSDCAAVLTAGDRLVAAGERLIRARLRGLESFEGSEVSTAARAMFREEPSEWDLAQAVDELALFRSDRILGSTAVPGFIQGVDQMVCIGLTADLAPSMVPVQDFRGRSGVCALAGFVAMWRLGLWATRTRSKIELGPLAVELGPLHDPRRMQAWLQRVLAAADEAADWLEREAFEATGVISGRQEIEAVEEFLNLPLWRQRHLLYEVWILCATLGACESAGWAAELRSLIPKDGLWILSVGPTDEPVAMLRHSRNESTELEVWREPARRTMAGLLTPDVTISTPGPRSRDLLVVEAKDRQKMTVGRVPLDSGVAPSDPGRAHRSALDVGFRYAAGLLPMATWVCNHCDFRQGSKPEINYGDRWTRVHIADQFRPGSIPAAFTESVRSILSPAPPEHEGSQGARVLDLLVVVDVTESMGRNLDSAFTDLSSTQGAPFRSYRAVLYSDHSQSHGDAPPFLVRKVGPFASLAELVRGVRTHPQGGGGDIEEALEDAMERCRELADDLGAQAILVLTDAPPHNVADCPYGIDFRAEVQALLQLGCRFFVASDWLRPDDSTWAAFADATQVSMAPLRQLVADWVPSNEGSGPISRADLGDALQAN